MWEQALLYCYYLGMFAAILKAGRYAVDAHRNKQRFFLVGVPANLALAAALLILAARAGGWPGEWLRLGIRLSFVLWADMALLFEILYIASFTKVIRDHEGDKNV